MHYAANAELAKQPDGIPFLSCDFVTQPPVPQVRRSIAVWFKPVQACAVRLMQSGLGMQPRRCRRVICVLKTHTIEPWLLRENEPG